MRSATLRSRAWRALATVAVLLLASVAPVKASPAVNPTPYERLQWAGYAGEFLGTTDSRVPCIGDGSSDKRVQVIYAYPNDVVDNYSNVVAGLRLLAANVSREFSAGAGETKGQRQIRFVTDTCQLDVQDVALNMDSASTSFDNVVNDLSGQGYNRADRDYLVYLDSDGSNLAACGRSGGGNHFPKGGPSGGQYSIVASNCWSDVDDHELLHSLGAVGTYMPSTDPSPPHGTSDGHCWDRYDGMCVTNLHSFIYPCPWWHWDIPDCRHDDYFSTHPKVGSYLYKYWNAANSPFLQAVKPVNDSFANALPLTTGVVWGSNVKATAEPGEPHTSGQIPAHSVWYRFDAAAGNQLVLDTYESTADTVLGVYTGSSPNALTLVKQNDNVNRKSKWSRVSIGSTAATTYYVRVDGHGGSVGSVHLNVRYGNGVPVITGFTPASGPPGTEVTVHGSNLYSKGPHGFITTLNGTYLAFDRYVGNDAVFTVQYGSHSGKITFSNDNGFAFSLGSFKVT